MGRSALRLGWFIFCKDNEFRANHNLQDVFASVFFDGLSSAKIMNLEQITTMYNSLSLHFGWFIFCKDNEFRANHNAIALRFVQKFDGLSSAKIMNLEQITTFDFG